MQLLHGLCCFDFISDIPLPPVTLRFANSESLMSKYSICSMQISCAKNPLQKEQVLVTGAKQGRQADKVGWPTRQLQQQGRQAGE